MYSLTVSRPLRAGTRSLVCLLVSAFSLAASTYDLTAGGSVNIHGAVFTTTDAQSTGTGLIASFVRIQRAGTEQGYNTDARPVQFDENTSGEFTRGLPLSAVPVVTRSGAQYREFLLDINQSNGNPTLSLDDVQIWLRSGPGLTGFTSLGCAESNCYGTGFDSGNQVFAMDASPGPDGDNTVLLNYSLNSGSGSGDLLLYILTSAFTGPNQFVYLYSRFGGHARSNAGFEEWAVRATVTPIPEPTPVVLFSTVVALVGLCVTKRWRP